MIYIKPREAAKRLGVTRHTIYRWIREGKLRSYATPGDRIMVSEDDIDGLFRERGNETKTNKKGHGT